MENFAFSDHRHNSIHSPTIGLLLVKVGTYIYLHVTVHMQCFLSKWGCSGHCVLSVTVAIESVDDEGVPEAELLALAYGPLVEFI